MARHVVVIGIWTLDPITDFPAVRGSPLCDWANAAIPLQPQSRGKAVPFTAAPCYPYELASKNKTIGEI
jgi:hypothetical protein